KGLCPIRYFVARRMERFTGISRGQWSSSQIFLVQSRVYAINLLFATVVLVLQLYLRRKQSLSVMIKPRHGLMSPSPIKPSPNMNQRNNLLPKDFFQEPSHFRNRQGHRSPRLRLNAVKLWKEPLPFFRRSDGIPCARMT